MRRMSGRNVKQSWKHSDHHTHVNAQTSWLNTEPLIPEIPDWRAGRVDSLDGLTEQRPLSLLYSVHVK